MELQYLCKTFMRGRFFAQNYEAEKNVRSAGRTSPTKAVCHQQTVFISAIYTVAPPKRRKIEHESFLLWISFAGASTSAAFSAHSSPVPLRHEVGTSYHYRTMGSFSLSSISLLFSEGKWVTDCIDLLFLLLLL